MTKLSDFRGRDNNFNLLRIVAALAVLLSHSFALSMGNGDAEPLRKIVGVTFGTVAVDMFFITSGFLVTGSLLKRQSAIEFMWARVLRIFPALLVMVLLTVFGLGLFFTTTSVSSYLSDAETRTYLVKNSSLITGVVYNLPGVFERNPHRGVNGSLWTMPYELRMYATLMAGWIVLRLVPKARIKILELAIVSLATVAGIGYVISHFYLNAESTYATYARFVFMFFTGASFYVSRERIILSRPLFWMCLVALVVATVNKQVFFVVYSITVAYLLFYLAYVPTALRAYNRVGDYSYGVYIYAFPVQQSVAALIPGVSVLSLFLISTALTLTLAAMSWHFLERHALNLKGLYVNHTRRLLGRAAGASVD